MSNLKTITQRSVLVFACSAVLAISAGCATSDGDGGRPGLTAPDARTLIVRLLPQTLPDRAGWATDIYAALATQDIAATAENICAVLAVTEQESTFRADPAVPGLAAIAWQEIDRQADRAGVPKMAVHTALRLTSSSGKSYSERIDAATTEKQLSDIFEDFIGMVPLGKTFLASRNPIRTGGPMQVSIAFAEGQTASNRYPYPIAHSIRHEVFTRRGGMYFGIAHLLDYEAPYPQPLYRFADFNAGRYASRNAAFQNALSIASGVPLVLDGDLLPPGVAADAARRQHRARCSCVFQTARHRSVCNPSRSRAWYRARVRAHPPLRACLRARRSGQGTHRAACCVAGHHVEKSKNHAQVDHRVVCTAGR